ncbi:DUF1727 domain-containing protein [Candidatus Saccharibacteria bacterium]|nr:DUF1727 domain-containing protein [Candidatus Saccharibacteria bacterium]
MPKKLVTIIGKAVKSAARLRGGGSALPGMVVEHIDPNFIKQTLSTLPLGTVIVSGTNGKTTTTKMVVELLEGQGLKVFTNRTGSNFTRGVAAALLGDININGQLKADIAVLELDEAHAVHFVDKIPPRYCLILNVMRDQLDRFGEIDHTAKLLEHVAQKTSDTVVLNREDPLVAAIASKLSRQNIRYFGLSPELVDIFPSDERLHTENKDISNNQLPTDVLLSRLVNQTATFEFDNQSLTADLEINGIYNIFNAAAALSLVRAVMGDKLNLSKLTSSLEKITPAFGRGETIVVGGQKLELILVKNPSGFRLGLKSFDPSDYKTMIAINDNYADGRDMSWLWDVDFTSLGATGVDIVTGIRAYDMALRLQYDKVPFREVNPDIKKAVKKFIDYNKNSPKRIYCTYTAMLSIRRLLSKYTKIEGVIS